MKIRMIEHSGCFCLDLTAETMEDAALLARFGSNSTSEIRHRSTSAHADGNFTTALVFGKGKTHTVNLANWHRKDKS